MFAQAKGKRLVEMAKEHGRQPIGVDVLLDVLLERVDVLLPNQLESILVALQPTESTKQKLEPGPHVLLTAGYYVGRSW